MKKLFILGDSPTKNSGFGRVVRNLIREWQALGAFDEIHVWGIGYWGNPHEFPGVSIWPAAGPNDPKWESVGNLTRFAEVVKIHQPTHVWMLQDLWGVMPLSNFIQDLTGQGVSTTLYFPVDAPLEPYWTRIIASVAHPVAYCEYGRTEAVRALRVPESRQPQGNHKEWRSAQTRRELASHHIAAIPHGADSHWIPTPPDESGKTRRTMFGGAVKPDDFLMVNVAMNQRRKGLTQSLQTLAELRKLRPEAKLYLHMASENKGEGINLVEIARQLGLEPDRDVFFGDRFHAQGHPTLDDKAMRLIYGMADLFLSTSLGEGWGLPITEAMACGIPVAAPDHTAITEIIGKHDDRGLLLPCHPHGDVMPGDNNRLRHRTQPEFAALLIDQQGEAATAIQIAAAHAWVSRDEMRWPSIARRWLEVMQ